jgi:hypothetical protein
MTIAIAVCPTCGARTDDYLSRHFYLDARLGFAEITGLDPLYNARR